MTQTKTAEEWLRLISHGQSWRYYTSGTRDCDWANYQRYYQGNWNKVIQANMQKHNTVTVNRGFAYVRSMAPRIYYRNPKVVISWENQMRATLEKIDNHLIRVLGMKKLMKRLVLDTLIYGIGIVKVGYSSEFSVSMDEEEPAIRHEYSSTVKRGFPWAKRVHPTDFVMPFGTTDLEDSRWCAHRILRTVEDVKAESAYSHTDNVVPTFKYNLSQLPATFTSPIIIRDKKVMKNPNWIRKGDNELHLVELWEIRDRATGDMIVVSVGCGDILYKDKDPMAGQSFPFKTTVYNEDPTSAWGISTLRIMEPQLLELNNLRTQQSRARRTSLMKILYNKLLFKNNVDIEAMLDGNDIRTAIPINGPPDKAVKELTTHIPFDFFQVGDMIEDDLRMDIGFSRNMAGIVSKGRRPAAEIATVRESGEVTVDERRDTTIDTFVDIIQTMNRLIFDFWDENKAKELAGQDAIWTPPSSDLMYSIEVNPEDARATNHQQMQQDAITLYQVIRQDPLADPFGTLSDLLEAFKKDPARRIDPRIARAVMVLMANPEVIDKLEAAAMQREQGGEQGA